MNRRAYLAGVAATATAGLAGCTLPGLGGSAPDDSTTTVGDQEVVVETFATGLEVPWGAAFRDGDLYLTERPGRIVRVRDGEREVVRDMTDSTAASGEAGLLGLVFHPDDPDVAYTYQTHTPNTRMLNRILRHDVGNDWAFEEIVSGIPGATTHDGGRLAVGPEGALYATAGDARERDGAQDTETLNGKVLRLTLDGEPHPDNHFDNAVFTYGHRNPQGLAFRDDGVLFSSEHGPDRADEINVLEAGNNYGWPDVMGDSGGEYTDPLVSYTPTIAPGSAAFYDGPISQWQGDLFVPMLKGSYLRRIRFDNRTVTEQEQLLVDEFGRLRTAFSGPGGHLYVTTSNRDGRGLAKDGDDRVIRLRPA
ncbi:sorbosone dehydrogenase family protein [Haladaptatus sp. DYSN1]|uniref:PQQ-dependent sugar dehydrogenase n=1 Tax=unclassified Haladaptatus TaxID=2622732 RepID=UPI002406479E|nr:PQQ-dependent sugar dehydrogenase [Haladaptatus sp. DYSN1]